MLESTDHEAEESAPIDMLEAYFAAHGWEHERHDEEIVATVKGSWARKSRAEGLSSMSAVHRREPETMLMLVTLGTLSADPMAVERSLDALVSPGSV